MAMVSSIKGKLAASGLIIGLGALVLISNYIDRKHTENVKQAISTLYEDRLIAEEYILRMTTGLYEVRLALNTDSNEANQTNNIKTLLTAINEEGNAYLKTKFTDAETSKSDEFFAALREFESLPMNDSEAQIAVAKKALGFLSELSAIQIEESKQIMARAESLYQTGKTSSQFVYAILIILLLVLQAFVFTSKRKTASATE